MNWKNEWRMIDERITGLISITTPFFASCDATKSDYYGVSDNAIIPSGREVRTEIESFLNKFSTVLPTKVKTSINKFIKTFDRSKFSGISGSGSIFVLLGVLKTEVSYYLKDLNQEIFTRSEFAFMHLQRSIVADSTIRMKWIEAFNSGETALEKLGAAHLLSHRLWAFKTHGEGERTDLIVSEPISEENVLSSGANLILTEWKKISSNDTDEKSNQGFEQAKRYGVGLLGGVELNSIRYIILVSKDHIILPNNHIVNEIQYKFLNIATNPSTPSKRI